MTKTNEINKIITDKILNALDAGIVAWNKPWKVVGNGAPVNVATKKNYRGVNIVLLGIETMTKGYKQDQWVTYKQAQKLGGNVKKGQKSTQIYFWNINKKVVEDKQTGEKVEIRKGAFLKCYNVFNIEQCENIEPLEIEVNNPDFKDNEICEALSSNYLDTNKVSLEIGKTSAYYRKDNDSIGMPTKESFDTETDFYATLYHEMAHSTGHKSRLDRLQDGVRFGDNDYGQEELVAEFTSAFLCGHTNIENIQQNASYIDNWTKAIKADDTLIMKAVGRAQKAFDFIIK